MAWNKRLAKTSIMKCNHVKVLTPKEDDDKLPDKILVYAQI